MTDDAGSVSLWLAELKTGEVAALQPLWDRYFRRLVGLARARLGQAGRGAEEDVALDALDSLCRGATNARFPKLDDRDDLWRLLACLAARKAGQVRRREGRAKRGGGAEVIGDGDELAGVLSEDPSPEMGAMLAEESRRLLGALGDDELRRIAHWRMEGFTNDEIAERLGCVPRTVERKLALIRATWSAAT